MSKIFPIKYLLDFMEYIGIENPSMETSHFYLVTKAKGFEVTEEDEYELICKVVMSHMVVYLGTLQKDDGISDKDSLFIELTDEPGIFHEFRRWTFGPSAYYEGTFAALPRSFQKLN